LRVCVFFCQFSVVELVAVTHGPLRLGMDLLMTAKMNHCQIAVGIFASLGPGQEMMNLKFFVIEEGFPPLRAAALLPGSQLLFGERQVAACRCAQ
jgi:hypothetical protein